MNTQIQLPQGMAYGWWSFPVPAFEDLTFEIDIQAVNPSIGIYNQLYQGKIADTGFYLGFQTNLFKPNIGWVGPGFIFSKWGARNNQDAKIVPGGYIESSDKEGDFLGIRLPYHWETGQYKCYLKPMEIDSYGRWYSFDITYLENEESISVGALRFDNDAEGKCMIQSGGGSWTEVYSGVSFIEDVPESYLTINRISANQGSITPTSCHTSYNSNFPASDAFLLSKQALVLRSGKGVVRRHEAKQLDLHYAK